MSALIKGLNKCNRSLMHLMINQLGALSRRGVAHSEGGPATNQLEVSQLALVPAGSQKWPELPSPRGPGPPKAHPIMLA